MKRFFVSLFVVAFCSIVQAQSIMIGLYKDSVNLAKTDTAKAAYLYKLSYYYQYYKPDSALLLAQSSYFLSQKAGFLKGETASLGQMALACNRLGDFSKALKYYLDQLILLEKKKDPYDMASAYLSIALVYNSQKDAGKALYYAYKADSIARSDTSLGLHLYTSLDIGDIYSKNNQLDSALFYTIICYNESIEKKRDVITGTALNNLGNIYFKAADYDSALYYFKSSIPFLDATQDYNSMAECFFGLAQCFDKKAMPDSALYYAKKSFYLASDNQFLKHTVNASDFLSKLYKKQNNIDSAFVFQQTYIDLKDSFDNAEKIKQLQILTINEQARQDLAAQQLAEQNKERRLRLEVLLVGMFIPILFLITALISGKKVNRRIIKFSGIFSLLFLFEYITLLLHPWVMEKTDHSPFFEIVIFVAIAAIISPTHHRIEAWLIAKLSIRHQNRMNRILAAKAAAEAARAAEKEAKDAAEAAKAASKMQA